MFVRARLPVLFIFALIALLFAFAVNPSAIQAAAQSRNTLLAPTTPNNGCPYGPMMWNSPLYGPYYFYPGMGLNVPCAAPYANTYGYLPTVSNNYGYSRNVYNGYGNNRYSTYGYNSYGNICAYHTVIWGENLFRIALRYGMTWPALAAANHLYNPNFIFAGMRLVIPCANGNYAYGRSPYSSSSGMNSYGQNPYSSVPSSNPSGMPPTNATPPAPMPGQTTNVTIQDFNFAPASITIHVGQTVVWRNNGPSMHTVTSNSGAFNSGTLNPGATFSHTFSTTGTFAYHCAIHPMMMGTVTVVP